MKSFLNSTVRRAKLTDLPGETEATEDKSAGAAPAVKPAKKTKAEKKAPAKAAKAEKPAKKGKAPAVKEKAAGKALKAKKEAKEKSAPKERKPRVEGRVDLVHRNGGEAAIMRKIAEDMKLGERIKVDNCTFGYSVTGAKAEKLRATYQAYRDELRKRIDATVQKLLSGEIKVTVPGI